MQMGTGAVVLLTIMTLWSAAEGAFLSPTAYTLTGVMAVNGSNANGGCPTSCVGVVDGVTTCDCKAHSTLGEEAITGVLIDGVIPTIDTVERNTANELVWAAPLFTVRGSTDTAVLGFRFNMSVALHEVELHLFHCPVWGIGAGNIVIHNGATFPLFARILSSIGSVTVSSEQDNCDSLTRVSIPLEMVASTSIYFIEFTTTTKDQIEWLQIAEVRFNDQPITTSATTTEEPTAQSLMPTTGESTTDEATTVALTMNATNTTGNPSATTATQDMPITTSSAPDTTDLATSEATSEASTSTATGTAAQSSFPVAVVGPVVGVIAALIIIILILGAVVIVGCLVGRRKRIYRTEVEHLQDVVLERNNTNGTDKSIKLNSLEKKSADENSHYQKTQFDMKMRSQRSQSSPPAHTVVAPGGVTITDNGVSYSKLPGASSTSGTGREDSLAVDESGYSDVAILASSPKSDTYDDVRGTDASDGQYSTIDTRKKQHANSELHEEAPMDMPQPRETGYSVVLKSGPPLVPPKTPELYRDLKKEKGKDPQNTETEADDQCYAEVDENVKKGLLVAYKAHTVSSSGGPGSQEGEEAAYYTTINDDTTMTTPAATPTGSAPLGEYSELEGGGDSTHQDDVYSEVDSAPEKKQGLSGSLVISNANVDDMENNPTYDSADILTTPREAHPQDEDAIYTNPDAQNPDAQANHGENIYDVVYSEQIKPSMFVKSPERVKEKGSSPEQEEEEEEEAVYAPIYSLTSSMNSSNLLTLKPENIHKIKTLGTGFFGKVLLADTVGLSPKDLKISETDDDKAKTTRVAVKTLRSNPSPERRETFEKELKFMSRLNHPNVVRTLGACTVDSPFIVMEYMEKGDLNQHLQNFDSIVPGNVPPTHLTISVGTLVYMSAQIADAMKYLTSRNYIHRDLATRNCLVGAESKIKVADFGMSKSLYESHYYIIKGHAILPVRWMARECFYGRFSAKTDVWAFGVTLWEMFTLAKDIPYEDMDDSEVAADGSKLKGDRQLLQCPKDCPEDVYAVMLMCWQRESSDRATFDKLHETLSTIQVKD